MKSENIFKLKMLSLASAMALLAVPSTSQAAYPVIDAAAIASAIEELYAIVEEEVTMQLAGTDVNQSIMNSTAATQASAQAQMDYQQQLAAGQVMLDAQIQANKTYGAQGIVDLCQSENRGLTLLEGSYNLAQVKGAYNTDAINRNHNFTKSSDILSSLNDQNFVTKKDIISENLVPQSMVYVDAATEKKAGRMMAISVNASPPLNLMDTQGTGVNATSNMEDNTLAGRKYKEIRKVYDAKALVPTANAMEYVANRTGKYDYSEYAKELWTKIGGSGTYYGVDGSGSKMSMMSSLNLDVIARYENPSWYADVMGVYNMDGLLREQTMMAAVSLKQEWENYRMVRDMALMQAQASMEHLNETLGQTLDGLRVEAHKQNSSGATN